MKENTVTTPQPVADKQKIKKSSQVVVGAESEKRRQRASECRKRIMTNEDYTYWQHLAETLERRVREDLMWCSTSLEIPEHLKEDWDILTAAMLQLSEAIVRHTHNILL
ncbi:unnamed protein product [Macrosiphum euphorbiae]|nr:unnamed protein product [Macrosiphum euphorbiae]